MRCRQRYTLHRAPHAGPGDARGVRVEPLTHRKALALRCGQSYALIKALQTRLKTCSRAARRRGQFLPRAESHAVYFVGNACPQTACRRDDITTGKPLPCVIDSVTRSTKPCMPEPGTLEGRWDMMAFMTAARFSESCSSVKDARPMDIDTLPSLSLRNCASPLRNRVTVSVMFVVTVPYLGLGMSPLKSQMSLCMKIMYETKCKESQAPNPLSRHHNIFSSFCYHTIQLCLVFAHLKDGLHPTVRSTKRRTEVRGYEPPSEASAPLPASQ